MISMQIIGFLSRDASKKEVNGNAVIDFSVPHNEKYNKGGNEIKETTWVNCNWWVKSTAILPYLTKGALVYVTGRPFVREYVGKDGVKKSSLELLVQSVSLLPRGQKDDHEGTGYSPSPNDPTGATGGGSGYMGVSPMHITEPSQPKEDVKYEDDLPF